MLVPRKDYKTTVDLCAEAMYGEVVGSPDDPNVNNVNATTRSDGKESTSRFRVLFPRHQEGTDEVELM